MARLAMRLVRWSDRRAEEYCERVARENRAAQVAWLESALK